MASWTARSLSLRTRSRENVGEKSPSTARGAIERNSPLTVAAPESTTVSTKTPGSSPAACGEQQRLGGDRVDDAEHQVVRDLQRRRGAEVADVDDPPGDRREDRRHRVVRRDRAADRDRPRADHLGAAEDRGVEVRRPRGQRERPDPPRVLGPDRAGVEHAAAPAPRGRSRRRRPRRRRPRAGTGAPCCTTGPARPSESTTGRPAASARGPRRRAPRRTPRPSRGPPAPWRWAAPSRRGRRPRPCRRCSCPVDHEPFAASMNRLVSKNSLGSTYFGTPPSSTYAFSASPTQVRTSPLS